MPGSDRSREAWATRAVAAPRGRTGAGALVGEINLAILDVVVNAPRLIGDAVAATGERGTITVQLRQDGNDAVISIADTGTGIPEHARTRIFD